MACGLDRTIGAEGVGHVEKGTYVFVPCKFSRGMMNHERLFIIPFDDGTEYRSTVSWKFAYGRDRKVLAEDFPKDTEIEGLVPGIVIAVEPNDEIRLQLPDGDIYILDRNLIVPFRPTRAEGTANVSVEP
jgi:hypothetical protein